MATDPLGMEPERMRKLGYRVVDRLVERLAGLGDEPTWRWRGRKALAADLHAALGAGPPARATDPDALLDLLFERVMPYASRVDHPRFFGYVPGSPTWPGILGDALAAGYNVFAGTSQASSGPGTLELEVLDWFREWIGYPATAEGLLTTGGSAANLGALVCAREAHVARDGDDAAAERFVLYASDQTHSSLIRAARIVGVPAARMRTVPTNEGLRLDVGALQAAVEADAARGLRPWLVAANGGTTSTGAVDPLPELVPLCARLGLWLHVDAAYGGFAVLTARGREALRGIERADSVVLDPHKWLYQPFETGCLLVREGRLLSDAFHIMPDYLQDTAVSGGEVNFADRGLQLTRMARGIKVWLSLHTFGVPAFAEAVERSLDLAAHAAACIEARPELEMLSPQQLGIVCFRRHPAGTDDEAELERINAALVRGLAASGLGLVSSTRLRGRYALRVCALNHGSTREDVERVIAWLAEAALDEGENGRNAHEAAG